MASTAPNALKFPHLPENVTVLNQHLNDYYLSENEFRQRGYSTFWRNLRNKLQLISLRGAVRKKTAASIIKHRKNQLLKQFKAKEKEFNKKKNDEIVKFYNNPTIMEKLVLKEKEKAIVYEAKKQNKKKFKR